MTQQVPFDQIEQIVGAPRHPTEHLGRAVSAEQTIYILHSQDCRSNREDLTTCPFSRGLDRMASADAELWPKDQPLRLQLQAGSLSPRPLL